MAGYAHCGCCGREMVALTQRMFVSYSHHDRHGGIVTAAAGSGAGPARHPVLD